MQIADEKAAYKIRYYHLSEGEHVRQVLEDYDIAIEEERKKLDGVKNESLDLNDQI